jgi:hypothetical protein
MEMACAETGRRVMDRLYCSTLLASYIGLAGELE